MCCKNVVLLGFQVRNSLCLDVMVFVVGGAEVDCWTVGSFVRSRMDDFDFDRKI